MSALKRLGATTAVLGLIGAGVLIAPGSAKAWWHGGFSFGIVLPPVVVAPPVYVPPPVAYYPPPAYYAPPPVYYAPPPPHRVWVPGHWQNGYWVAPHWA